jgi:SDR family mycofactocin-dependent oxidoreductase
MAGRMEGKVALITGAARGQGRSHAVRLAQEGADIIAVDICRQIPSVPYPMATPEDLSETEQAVKELGRAIVTAQADVRDREKLREAVDDGMRTLGRLDVVVANAAVLPMAMGDPDPMDFVDATDVCLVGVMNTVAVALPHLPDGASIIVTGSFAAMIHHASNNPIMGPGGAGYDWSKGIIKDYVDQLGTQLASRFIRVNAVHPTNCKTDMLLNEGMYRIFMPHLDNPTQQDAEPAFATIQGMPIPYIEPIDSSNAVLFLASDESRYVTGQQLRVDAGALLKMRLLHPELVKDR